MMGAIEIDSSQMFVLTYLKKMKLHNKSAYDKIIIFGAKPHDIIKFIERPEDCGRWPIDFVYKVQSTIPKISKMFLIDFPKIEQQTEEDRILSKLLRKNNFPNFDADTFFGIMVSVNHVIQFLERDPVIYEWNAFFVLQVSEEVIRVKEKLL